MRAGASRRISYRIHGNEVRDVRVCRVSAHDHRGFPDGHTVFWRLASVGTGPLCRKGRLAWGHHPGSRVVDQSAADDRFFHVDSLELAAGPVGAAHVWGMEDEEPA